MYPLHSRSECNVAISRIASLAMTAQSEALNKRRHGHRSNVENKGGVFGALHYGVNRYKINKTLRYNG